MRGEAPAELQAATIAACLHAFESIHPAPLALHIRYALYADRIEIEVAQSGQPGPRPVKRLTKHCGPASVNT